MSRSWCTPTTSPGFRRSRPRSTTYCGRDWRCSAIARRELYGAPSCQYTAELRAELEWQGQPFVEYDVEADDAALARMLGLTGGNRTIPVLVKDGRVVQTGWQGRGCHVAPRGTGASLPEHRASPQGGGMRALASVDDESVSRTRFPN